MIDERGQPMRRGDLDWLKWYVDVSWREEVRGDVQALVLRKIEAAIEVHRRRNAAIRSAAKNT